MYISLYYRIRGKDQSNNIDSLTPDQIKAVIKHEKLKQKSLLHQQSIQSRNSQGSQFNKQQSNQFNNQQSSQNNQQMQLVRFNQHLQKTTKQPIKRLQPQTNQQLSQQFLNQLQANQQQQQQQNPQLTMQQIQQILHLHQLSQLQQQQNGADLRTLSNSGALQDNDHAKRSFGYVISTPF